MVSVERLTKGHKLVQGVGVNDADYTLHKHEVINGKRKVVGTYPDYTRWASLFRRCYSKKEQDRYPTYKGCARFNVDGYLVFIGKVIGNIHENPELCGGRGC